VRAGIKQVERSERAKDLILNKVDGRKWIGVASKDAVTSNLVQATHLLLTDIRHPEQGGRYQVSMRLVDVLTGEILWEDQGDRQSTTGSPGDSRQVNPQQAELTGSWRSPAGDRLEIKEDATGTLHASVTTSNGDVNFEITAHRQGPEIAVDSCIGTVGKGSDAATLHVKAQFRAVTPQSLELGGQSVTVSSRGRASAGKFTWATFRKKEVD
jgi:hypothetical protein